MFSNIPLVISRRRKIREILFFSVSFCIVESSVIKFYYLCKLKNSCSHNSFIASMFFLKEENYIGTSRTWWTSPLGAILSGLPAMGKPDRHSSRKQLLKVGPPQPQAGSEHRVAGDSVQPSVSFPFSFVPRFVHFPRFSVQRKRLKTWWCD